MTSRSLVRPDSGKQEPGYMPPSKIWGSHGTKPHDTWAMMEGRNPQNYQTNLPLAFVNGQDTVRSRVSNKIISHQHMEYYAKDPGWDEHISDIKFSIPQGLEWEDPTDDVLRMRNVLPQKTPEAAFLHPHICAALRAQGITELTRPQTAALYYLHRGRDLFLHSHPGSGKTSAAVWFVLNKMLKEYPNAPNSTVWICPTENLAHQTMRWFHTLGKLVGIPDDKSYCLCVDSKDLERNYEEIEQNRPAVLIGTPNRLGDLLHTPNSPLYDLETCTLTRIVVDEVEAVLTQEDKQCLGLSVLHVLQPHRKWKPGNIKYGQIPSQKIFLSATMPQKTVWDLREFVLSRRARYVGTAAMVDRTIRPTNRSWKERHEDYNDDVFEPDNPLETIATNQNTGARSIYAMALQKDISHYTISCEVPLGVRNIPTREAEQYRFRVLAASVKAFFDKQNGEAERLARSDPGKQVFFRCLIVVENGTAAKAMAEELYKREPAFKGKVGRVENSVALKSYANGVLPILVSTPEFVRGMDLPNLTHVFNAFPIADANSAKYVRSAGRVGRSGRHGVCVTVALAKELKFMKSIASRLVFSTTPVPASHFGVSYAPTLLDSNAITTTEVKPIRHTVVRALPLARLLLEGESKELDVTGDNISLASTATLKAEHMKAMLIDDPDAVDGYIEGEDVHALQELNPERNIVKQDGSIVPDLRVREWVAGSTPGIFYDDDEKAAIHSQNVHEWLASDDPDKGQPSIEPDNVRRPLPSSRCACFLFLQGDQVHLAPPSYRCPKSEAFI